MGNVVGDTEGLYESHLKAQLGVIWKSSVAAFSLHPIERITQLSEQLQQGIYELSPSTKFFVTKPKKREILSIRYRDRVFQRYLNDNYIFPTMSRSFIKENGACQPGKGIDYCLNLFKSELRRFYINHGVDGYILKIDIKKYYPSMVHSVVKDMFREKLDPEIYSYVEYVLDTQYEGDVGYNPGSQMVQIAGIGLLSGLDHFIKEKLHIKDYIRVMDDMVLIHEDKEYLKYCLQEITKELDKLQLKTNRTKTHIVKLKDGISFLGFTWRVTDTGKVIQKPKRQNVRTFKYMLNKLMDMYACGERSIDAVKTSYQVRLNFLSKGNDRKLIVNLEKWYKERMEFYERKRERFLSSENSDSEGAGLDG